MYKTAYQLNLGNYPDWTPERSLGRIREIEYYTPAQPVQQVKPVYKPKTKSIEHFEQKKVSNAPAPLANAHLAKSTMDPKIWGPPYWTSLHISAEHYPDNPSPITMARTKGRILGIPYEIPCQGCRPHAIAFIEAADIDKAVSSRKNLAEFYIDFHNKVNARYGKKIYTYEEARSLYK
jgi:hypothetical protein